MASLMRIYQPVPLKTHIVIQLDKKASHHIARVLRANVGDTIMVFNGQCDGDFQGVIKYIGKQGVDVETISFIQRHTESSLSISLAQGMARGEKMDFIIQKATELGVAKIFPLMTDHCNVKLANPRVEKRLLHWQSVITSACEQSGRCHLPEIVAPLSLDEWLVLQGKKGQGFVLTPHVQTRLPEQISSSSISLLIGPEGGLSDFEIKKAQDSGFQPLNLGPRILRTETASIAALSIFQSFYGDMG